MDASLVLEDFFGRSRAQPMIYSLNFRSLWFFSDGPQKGSLSRLSIGLFQKNQSEVMEKMESRHKLSKKL